MELIHIVQLETAQFDNIIVVISFGHLQSQALPDVSGQTDIQSCTFKYMVNKRSGGCLSVTSRNANHLCIGVASCKLYFGNHRNILLFYF